ncbi:glycosyltransferase family 4 protein [bacterium LRH843]|nr:glycosyltransferase family 4 protein [bacterium LRH843]
MMKICYLAGASSIHTVRWVNAMAERGHEVSLITMHPIELDAIHTNVSVYKLFLKPPLGYYLNAIQVKILLMKIKPDIINTHYASGYGTLSRLVNLEPTLLSVWGSDVFSFPYESNSKRKILKKNLEAATRVASTGWVMKEQTEKFFSPNMEIAVTPFGIDMEKFKSVTKQTDTITIGTVKKLEEIYGIRYIIESFSSLIDLLKNSGQECIISKLRLLIVGGGSQLEEMKELTKKFNIEDVTTFTGAVPHSDVPKYLNKLDIYCALSLQESFGVAVIEASACEVPVIVSNVGGLPEVVRENDTGYIVESENSLQIADKLYELVLNPEKRKEMGKRGREFVQSIYNWEDNVKEMEDVYKKLIWRRV